MRHASCIACCSAAPLFLLRPLLLQLLRVHAAPLTQNFEDYDGRRATGVVGGAD